MFRKPDQSQFATKRERILGDAAATRTHPQGIAVRDEHADLIGVHSDHLRELGLTLVHSLRSLIGLVLRVVGAGLFFRRLLFRLSSLLLRLEHT